MVALTDGKNRSPRLPMSNVPTSFICPALLPPDLTLDKTISLGVLASGSGSNFAALAEAIAAQKLNAQIAERLNDSNFDCPQLARMMGLSEVQLYRKIKALTGQVNGHLHPQRAAGKGLGFAVKHSDERVGSGLCLGL